MEKCASKSVLVVITLTKLNETRINPIKERFRSIKAGLYFNLFSQLIIELVYFVVGRFNMTISQTALDGLCPRVRMTEVLIDAKKELNIGFGHLVVARNKNVISNDAMTVHGEVCITMRPKGNRQGSWLMLKLTTGTLVSRTQYVEVPFTDLAKARVNELAILANQGKPICVNVEIDFDEPEDIADDDVDYGRVHNIVHDFPFSSATASPASVSLKENGGEVSADNDVPDLRDDDDDV